MNKAEMKNEIVQAQNEELENMKKKMELSYESIEGTQVKINYALTKSVVATKTKNGNLPNDQDIFKFMALCHARKLNPFVGDAYLIGYDSREGTHFNMIVSYAALLKRAELSMAYNGKQSGLILRNKKSGEVREEEGAFYIPQTDEIVGGWAKVYRTDREYPETARVMFDVYDTGRSRWQIDPAGMIVKVACSAAFRQAFPGETAGLYIREEMDSAGRDEHPVVQNNDIVEKPESLIPEPSGIPAKEIIEAKAKHVPKQSKSAKIVEEKRKSKRSLSSSSVFSFEGVKKSFVQDVSNCDTLRAVDAALENVMGWSNEMTDDQVSEIQGIASGKKTELVEMLK